MSEELENKFLELCAKYPAGLNQQMMEMGLGHKMEDVAKVINNLLKQGRLLIHQNPDETTSYREVNPEDQMKFRGLGAEDFLIYQLIETSGNNGAWTRELKQQSGYQQVQITKILKILENRKLIKAVKSIQSGRKKVYMLYNMEPSRDVTGGTLYGGDQSYDHQYIQIMKMHIKTFVENKGAVDLSDIMTYLRKVAEEATSQSLGPEDIQALVNTVIYDGDIEEMRDTRMGALMGRRSGILYKPTKTSIPVNNFCNMPCGNCPVFEICSDDGIISPKKCVYFQQFLDQTDDLDF
ncbi:hypothetical protein DICPUDRAFT_88404 [Dictyostelium purpureum]|uniref:DNA-directed RNA polymerase III subunit RPC6 n=1 Tax=Dictyostelium purpureum TaxID=5786 RepID=F0ZP69_DICPU|nr:uncharacterized protein DICPUDRAFT_88404 [Dictyostelium purpureum]EGC34242.1 hypothetical protein DICPUDRAFT_88404 [Dictyostelium purpureum]|eukprot:XP_003289211.1 hypothetical protein DICPUDRAFT_88404 [Dictyostelium purpureum]